MRHKLSILVLSLALATVGVIDSAEGHERAVGFARGSAVSSAGPLVLPMSSEPDGPCTFCEGHTVLEVQDTVKRYLIQYGDYCGLNYAFWNCMECVAAGQGGGGSENETPEPLEMEAKAASSESTPKRRSADCYYAEREVVASGTWDTEDFCSHIHCPEETELAGDQFATIVDLVGERDADALAQAVLESNGRIYYSETASAIQILGCRNAIAGTYQIERNLGEAVQAVLSSLQ